MTRDKSVDATYIYLTDSTGGKSYGLMVTVDPEDIDGMINLDFDSDGDVTGIKILCARAQLSPETLTLAKIR
jgi:uncharacterized protein YuzE